MHTYRYVRKRIEMFVYYVLHEQQDIICTFPTVRLLRALYNKFEKMKMYVSENTNGLYV